MDKKSTVSALHEFCAQSKIGLPTFDYIDEEGGFACNAGIMDIEAYGNGRSKRDAKHLAAANLLSKLQKKDNMGDHLNYNEMDNNLTPNFNQDMIKELRDYCARNDMPLPIIEIVQQSGTPDSPLFVASCCIASITRYGKSDKKKDARQRAAIEMLGVIMLDDANMDTFLQVGNLNKTTPTVVDTSLDDIESQRRQKFKTYRELIDAGVEHECGVKICDAHNYFKKFHAHVKNEALAALAGDHDTSQEKVMELLNALKITHKLEHLKSNTMEPLLQISLDCELICVFIDHETKIYDEIIRYFQVMLI